jgi:hypothetical protein
VRKQERLTLVIIVACTDDSCWPIIALNALAQTRPMMLSISLVNLVLDFSCLRTGVRVVVVSIEKEYNIYFGVVL